MKPEELKSIVSETVAEEVAKLMKELPVAERKEVAEKIAAGRTPNADVVASVKFLGSLMDPAFTKDLSISTDANGGYLVPTEFYNTLVEKKFKVGYLKHYATIIPMGSDKMEIQTEGNDVSVNWTTELATITQSDPTFGQVILNVNLLAGLSRMSRQLLADAAINEGIAELVIRKFANKLGRTEDTAYMTGSGTGQPKGLRAYTISQSVAQAGASLASTDIVNLIHALPEQYRTEATFVLNDSILKLVRNLRSTDGKHLFEEAFNAGDNRVGTLFNRPVITQNDIPTNLGAGTNESEIWFGDISYYYIGDRQEVSAEVSTQEGTSFEKHRAAVKVTERLDGQLTITEAFAKLTAVK
ncbi:HK97 family phage major capsid protein [Pseudarthrobacter siccitolerans]|uniref:HK97 family phage major capsid protein n=1 Tax=Pseudarthrobacter siccitolerans TaxID=861266 RepID=A0ABU0PG49_9MICC|nr:phage major capsid protein [Pseudarthrobacter siccitolerans]MDQ0672944.1 HK97 family phage major capsid protein [Pseudarthrobacter siccitolerans]